MSQTSLDFLWSPTPPWIYVGTGEADRAPWTPSHFYSLDGVSVCTRRLRGWKMRSTAGLMSEIGAALQFFDGFGENWHALEECLCYLDEWLPAEAYVIVVERAEETLADDEEGLRALLTTLQTVGEFWSEPVDEPDRFTRGPVPFHVLLNVSSEHPGAARRIAEVAASESVAIRMDSVPT